MEDFNAFRSCLPVRVFGTASIRTTVGRMDASNVRPTNTRTASTSAVTTSAHIASSCTRTTPSTSCSHSRRSASMPDRSTRWPRTLTTASVRPTIISSEPCHTARSLLVKALHVTLVSERATLSGLSNAVGSPPIM